MEKLKRSRTAARGWATRTCNTLQNALSDENPDLFELKELKTECEQRVIALDEAQSAFELELSETELLKDIEEASCFRDGISKVMRLAAKLLAGAEEREGGYGAGSGGGQSSLRLPRLDLPKFSGDVLEWPNFWESFQASVDNKPELTDVSKFTYLRSLLKEEAAQCISGLALTGRNYQAACDILQDRYGRPELIIFKHVQGLLVLDKAQNIKALQKLQDELMGHVRSLDALGVTGEKYGVILTPLVLSKLPKDICLQWARESAGREGDLQWLIKFLKEEIENRVRSGVFSSLTTADKDSTSLQGDSQKKKKLHRVPSGAALQSAPPAPAPKASSPPARRCGFCSGGHDVATCREFLNLDISGRQNKVRVAGLCFVCLERGHGARQCVERCAYCKSKHNILCCYKHALDSTTRVRPSTDSASESHPEISPTVSLSCVPGKQCSVLPTARVTVKGSKGTVEANVMFDTGSDRSYISQSLVKKVGATWIGSEQNAYCAFGGGKSTVSERNLYQVEVAGTNVPGPSSVCLKAMEVPVICSPLQRPQVPKEAIRLFGGLDLADSRFSSDRQLSVDLLVGLDQYWQLMRDGLLRTSAGLVAQETVFGWIVSGTVAGKTSPTSCQLLLLNDVPDHVFRNLWDLEAIGVAHDEDDVESDRVLNYFNSSVCMKEGRYEVTLPWKGDCPDLKDNRVSAEARLASLRRRFDRDPQLGERYDDVLHEMEQSGVIEEVPDDEMNSPHPVFYLPHRPVVEEVSVITKVRPVFDASAVGPGGVSLNDCLEVGPCLIPSLIEILLRFRRWRFAVAADIAKAFLQIQLRREDRDVHRFLWWRDGRIRVMRFLRVTFGVCSSSFLLSATIRHHLSRYSPSPLIEDLGENFYVDDYLSGADTEQDACAKLRDAQTVMSEAGMNLTKCTSNSPAVFDTLPGVTSAEAGPVKVLGVRWSPNCDLFSFAGVDLPTDVVPHQESGSQLYSEAVRSAGLHHAVCHDGKADVSGSLAARAGLG